MNILFYSDKISKEMRLSLTHLHFRILLVDYIQVPFATYNFAVVIALFN